jgi:hypothetical protein
MTVSRPLERPIEPRDAGLAPWRAFLLAHARVVRRLDEELRAEHDLTIGEYDALVTIAQAPDRRIRMRQLADEVIKSKSGVNPQIDRLVDDGLVERSACLADARAPRRPHRARPDAASSGREDAPARHRRAPLAILEGDDLAVLERALTAVATRAGVATGATATADPCRAGCASGRAACLSGWVPRLLRPTCRRRCSSTTRAARDRRAHNTFYRSPTPAAIAGWLAATPGDFRFAVKAQRGGSFRALQVDPATSVPWLTDPYRAFGERLGTVLFRVPDGVGRNDARLGALLDAWPRDLPLTVEFQDRLACRRDVAALERAPRCARPSCPRTRSRRPSGTRAASSTCACAVTITPKRS